MAQIGTETEEDLQLLDIKLKQLRIEYEQYFLGSRKREPTLLRGEVQKIVSIYSNISIQNTGLRFKFNNLRSRYFTFKRKWDMDQRKIEAGTYERHLFKANLHERNAPSATPRAARPETAPAGDGGLFDQYLEARQACGQGTGGITPEKLQAMLEKQEAAIREQTGCDAVRFRVAVENGKTKLKATAVRTGVR